jgi:hypothetical protein
MVDAADGGILAPIDPKVDSISDVDYPNIQLLSSQVTLFKY